MTFIYLLNLPIFACILSTILANCRFAYLMLKNNLPQANDLIKRGGNKLFKKLKIKKHSNKAKIIKY